MLAQLDMEVTRVSIVSSSKRHHLISEERRERERTERIEEINIAT